MEAEGVWIQPVCVVALQEVQFTVCSIKLGLALAAQQGNQVEPPPGQSPLSAGEQHARVAVLLVSSGQMVYEAHLVASDEAWLRFTVPAGCLVEGVGSAFVGLCDPQTGVMARVVDSGKFLALDRDAAEEVQRLFNRTSVQIHRLFRPCPCPVPVQSTGLMEHVQQGQQAVVQRDRNILQRTLRSLSAKLANSREGRRNSRCMCMCNASPQGGGLPAPSAALRSRHSTATTATVPQQQLPHLGQQQQQQQRCPKCGIAQPAKHSNDSSRAAAAAAVEVGSTSAKCDSSASCVSSAVPDAALLYAYEHCFVPFVRQWALVARTAGVDALAMQTSSTSSQDRLMVMPGSPAGQAVQLLNFLMDNDMWACCVLLLGKHPDLVDRVQHGGLPVPVAPAAAGMAAAPVPSVPGSSMLHTPLPASMTMAQMQQQQQQQQLPPSSLMWLQVAAQQQLQQQVPQPGCAPVNVPGSGMGPLPPPWFVMQEAQEDAARSPASSPPPGSSDSYEDGSELLRRLGVLQHERGEQEALQAEAEAEAGLQEAEGQGQQQQQNQQQQSHPPTHQPPPQQQLQQPPPQQPPDVIQADAAMAQETATDISIPAAAFATGLHRRPAAAAAVAGSSAAAAAAGAASGSNDNKASSSSAAAAVHASIWGKPRKLSWEEEQAEDIQALAARAALPAAVAAQPPQAVTVEDNAWLAGYDSGSSLVRQMQAAMEAVMYGGAAAAAPAGVGMGVGLAPPAVPCEPPFGLGAPLAPGLQEGSLVGAGYSSCSVLEAMGCALGAGTEGFAGASMLQAETSDAAAAAAGVAVPAEAPTGGGQTCDEASPLLAEGNAAAAAAAQHPGTSRVDCGGSGAGAVSEQGNEFWAQPCCTGSACGRSSSHSFKKARSAGDRCGGSSSMHSYDIPSASCRSSCSQASCASAAGSRSQLLQRLPWLLRQSVLGFDEAYLEASYLVFKNHGCSLLDATAGGLCFAMITIVIVRSIDLQQIMQTLAQMVTIVLYGLAFFLPYIVMQLDTHTFLRLREPLLVVGRNVGLILLMLMRAGWLPRVHLWCAVVINSMALQVQNAVVLPAFQQVRLRAALAMAALHIPGDAYYITLGTSWGNALLQSCIMHSTALVIAFVLDAWCRWRFLQRYSGVASAQRLQQHVQPPPRLGTPGLARLRAVGC